MRLKAHRQSDPGAQASCLASSVNRRRRGGQDARAPRQAFTLLLIGALVALLALLAVLQYRWLGQISVAERQTMQTNLRNQSRGLQEEINQEIDRASSKLQVSVDDFRKESWDELIDRYERWKAAAKYPGLIKDVFLARADEHEQSRLMQLDQTARRFDNVDWPPSLASIRKRFEPMHRSYTHETERLAKERQEEETRFGSLIEHGYVEEEVPAVVRFAVEFKKREEPREPAERERMKSVVVDLFRQLPLVILVLDIDYIKQEFVPTLFKRRFTINGTIDYELALIYAWPAEAKTEKRANEFSVASAGNETINMFVMGSNSEFNRGSRWQMLITHRAGSLDAAVAQARQRNLLASFGILSLLAVSVIIVIVISRRAQKLARKQMDFIAGVSHEFRTPLAVIHAISENLADGLITNQQQIEQCGVVIRNDTRRLAGMVEQVLEFAGASRGKNLYQPQPVDVKEMIEQALAANPTLETQKDWQVEKEIEPNVPPVLADPAALASAVRNIIDNAVKYGGDRHWIGIKAKAKTFDHAPTVEITIADRGIGIPESDLPHIFEPFYRGREVVAAQVHGNGLGLSLVKNIVDAHGGTISVSSAPGQGSIFCLSLPAANGDDSTSNQR